MVPNLRYFWDPMVLCYDLDRYVSTRFTESRVHICITVFCHHYITRGSNCLAMEFIPYLNCTIVNYTSPRTICVHAVTILDNLAQELVPVLGLRFN
jgi:hypothetical protein